VHARILGVAQDGGVPHLGCDCDRCAAARANPELVRYPASLLLDTVEHRVLVDATPDIRHQVERVDAVVLTHAHYGHLPGLLAFGREGADADALPVHCTPELAGVLEENEPFARLVADDNVDLQPFDGAITFEDLAVEPIRVPHRDELGAGTCAFRTVGDRRLFYAPDFDRWTDSIVREAERADTALVDGTFYSDGELDRQSEVPHPRVEASISRLRGAGTDVRFIHCNHTNPLLDADSPERAAVEQAGFAVAERGTTVSL
jgi:pyrroloquinoline quinone biosynthesis protein B